ncbi:hypothetical protein PF005_g7994 [Phytophthora fragariae]|uniref:Secreted protein n=1 Tax=Phytophthora fragariae TaxID=53985 RepID=A0A6A3YI29_9STRA|nr:hypothetical protein PF005_g7994 [Phytophthora fragariae]
MCATHIISDRCHLCLLFSSVCNACIFCIPLSTYRDTPPHSYLSSIAQVRRKARCIKPESLALSNHCVPGASYRANEAWFGLLLRCTCWAVTSQRAPL